MRLATTDDAPQIVALFKGVAMEDRWIRTQWPFDETERLERIRAGIEDGPSVRIVAERGTKIVAQLGLFPDDSGVAYLGMMVDRSARGCGLGRRLMEFAERLAVEQGCAELALEVYAHNEAALALYRRCGYAEFGERYAEERRSGERFEVIRMAKRLSRR